METNLPVKTQKFVASIMLYSLADNKFTYQPQQLVFWADQIQIDYPELTNDKFKQVILKGAKGRYKEKYESNISLSTVIKWIDTFLKEETEEKIKHDKFIWDRDCEIAMKKRQTIDQYYKEIKSPEDYQQWKSKQNIRADEKR